MKKTELKKAIKKNAAELLKKFFGKTEVPNTWGEKVFSNVFQYSAVSEYCMEQQLAETGKERITTYMGDLSIAEWWGAKGVLETVESAIVEQCNNEKYMAELVLCVNWKAWEHHARKNYIWSEFYSRLYEYVRDLIYLYYEDNEEKTEYLYNYLD